VDIDAGTNRCSTSPSARPRTCGADAAARYSDPAPPPAQGFAMSGDDIVVISPCTQVLSDYRLVLRSVVPSSPQSHRQSVLNVSLVSSGSSLRSRVHQEPNCETPGRADTDFGHVVLRVRAVAVVLGHGPPTAAMRMHEPGSPHARGGKWAADPLRTPAGLFDGAVTGSRCRTASASRDPMNGRQTTAAEALHSEPRGATGGFLAVADARRVQVSGRCIPRR
jgi:hypothetical protein